MFHYFIPQRIFVQWTVTKGWQLLFNIFREMKRRQRHHWKKEVSNGNSTSKGMHIRLVRIWFVLFSFIRFYSVPCSFTWARRAASAYEMKARPALKLDEGWSRCGHPWFAAVETTTFKIHWTGKGTVARLSSLFGNTGDENRWTMSDKDETKTENW